MPRRGDLFHQRRKLLARVDRGNLGHDRGRMRIRHLLDDLRPQQPRGAVIQFRKAGRDLGLKRKAAQKRGAKAVNGLNPQPAGRLQRAGKQPPRPRKIIGDKAWPLAQRGKVCPKLVIRQHGPFAKPLEQAVLHLGGGGLGVGQAQNPLRLHPAKEQPRHAVDQHPRLARPRIGGHPSCRNRAGGLNLAFGGLLTQAHSSTSLPTNTGSARSVICHSPYRARWSYSPSIRSENTARRAV